MNEVRELHEPIRRPGRNAAAVLAVVVHVLLAVFLIYGVRWQNSQPEAVEVDLVRSVPMPATATPAPIKQAPPEPQPAPEPKPAPPKPKIETPPPKPVTPPKPDIAIKDKPEKKPPPKPDFDPLKDLDKEEKQVKSQQHATAMSNAASKELAQMQASSSKSSNKADYQGRISAKIRGNLVVPPGLNGNPEAEFMVNQLPSGEVIEVKLKRTSGSTALDNAIERAIYKSSPLPKPEHSEDFSRSLDLKFRPLEQVPN